MEKANQNGKCSKCQNAKKDEFLEELFKTYLPHTYAMCTSISTNNAYLAIGEVNYSGTVIKSNIRIMSINSAETIYTYSSASNDIITSIQYTDKEKATCMFTNSVAEVTPTSGKILYNIKVKLVYSIFSPEDSHQVYFLTNIS